MEKVIQIFFLSSEKKPCSPKDVGKLVLYILTAQLKTSLIILVFLSKKELRVLLGRMLFT